ncbi:hypothetical protein ILYODFUR_013296 [Ilyodon furcidens]|uniref:Uncharacterized protein n=1 Tax=Ilyodon furcidens TaxID=33524 RepID=A0ABV0SWP3_9TELE
MKHPEPSPSSSATKPSLCLPQVPLCTHRKVAARGCLLASVSVVRLNGQIEVLPHRRAFTPLLHPIWSQDPPPPEDGQYLLSRPAAAKPEVIFSFTQVTWLGLQMIPLMGMGTDSTHTQSPTYMHTHAYTNTQSGVHLDSSPLLRYP